MPNSSIVPRRMALEEFLRESLSPTFPAQWGISDQKIQDNARALYDALNIDVRTHPTFLEYLNDNGEDQCVGAGQAVLEQLMQAFVPTLVEVQGQLGLASQETMNRASEALTAFLDDGGPTGVFWKPFARSERVPFRLIDYMQTMETLEGYVDPFINE